jgi:hypothetical protein
MLRGWETSASCQRLARHGVVGPVALHPDHLANVDVPVRVAIDLLDESRLLLVGSTHVCSSPLAHRCRSLGLHHATSETGAASQVVALLRQSPDAGAGRLLLKGRLAVQAEAGRCRCATTLTKLTAPGTPQAAGERHGCCQHSPAKLERGTGLAGRRALSSPAWPPRWQRLCGPPDASPGA